jgi:hypothetical protein
VLPLAIAGAAEARTHESGRGYGGEVAMESMADMDMMRQRAAPMSALSAPVPGMAWDDSRVTLNVAGGNVQTAETAMAGDLFEFTFRTPVSLARHQSAMFPLVEGSVQAEKTLVFSGSRASPGRSINRN